MDAVPTIDNYAFSLRQGLRSAATDGLSGLEGMIQEIGYLWLEGYVENILARSSSK